MGDSSDSVSVDMESISCGGKVPAFPVYCVNSSDFMCLNTVLCLLFENMLGNLD